MWELQGVGELGMGEGLLSDPGGTWGDMGIL